MTIDHRLKKPFFTGELMTCIICGTQERSHPAIESQWRALEVDGKLYYACPQEFPPDGSGKDDFENAYLLVLTKILLEIAKAAGEDIEELEQKFNELKNLREW